MALSFHTFEFWRYVYTHWNSYLILPNIWILTLFWYIGILTSSFETHIGILALSLHTLKFWSYRSNIGILALFFNIGFWSYPLKKPWDSGPISLSIGIMMLSLQTLDFWSYFYRNSDLILPNIGIRILTFQTMEFWPSFYKDWNNDLILPLVFWSCFYTHWNFDLILRNIEFWHYSYKHLKISCPRPSTAIIGIVALSFQTF